MNNFLLLIFMLNHYFSHQSICTMENNKNDLVTIQSNELNPQDYFSKHIIPADTEVINHNDSSSSTYSINNHHIKWQYSNTSTFVSIDDHKFEISKRHTLNNVSRDHQNDSLSNGYILYETKSFKYNDREILGFEFGVASCEGFSCRLDYQLFYDVKTMTINFFGEYHTGNSVDLYSFNDWTDLSFISVSYYGSQWGEDTCHFVYNIYNLNSQGAFTQAKDKNNKDYFIETKCSNFYGDCKIESKNWFELPE